MADANNRNMTVLNAIKKKEITFRAIFAKDRDCIIGYDNDLIFHNRDDLKFFKEKTMGNIVVMGSKTFASMGYQILPGRLNVIMTKSIGTQTDAYMTAHGITGKSEIDPTKLRFARDIGRVYEIAKETGKSSVWVIGGAQIFEYFFPYISTFVITEYNIGLLTQGSEYGFLPEDFDGEKLVDVGHTYTRMRRYRFSPTQLQSAQEFMSPSGKPITYRVMSYMRSFRTAKPSKEEQEKFANLANSMAIDPERLI